MKVVVTAFEPFGGKTSNRSLQIMNRLEKSPQLKRVEDIRFIEVPVVRGAPLRIMTEILRGAVTDYVLCIGEASRTGLALEHIAANERDYRIPDNEGTMSQRESIVGNGPDHYVASFPYEFIANAAKAKHIDTNDPDDAGRFLCNELLYAALHITHIDRSSARVGFVHVPAGFDESAVLTDTLTAIFEKTLTDMNSEKNRQCRA